LIPVLNALTKVERDLLGGTSRPWIVTVNNGGIYEEFVIKLYSNAVLSQVPLHNKELYAACIAMEFEITAPEPALVHLSTDFIRTLKGEDKIRIEELRSKFVFGSKFYDGYSDFPVSINPKLVKTLSPETVFAFDVLIRNFDRRRKKPNLITNGSDYLCIDHEHSLHVNRLFTAYGIQDWSPFRNTSSTHLFFDHLKKKRSVDFMEFMDLLRSFRVSSMDGACKVLLDNGLHIEDYEETKEYLQDVINNRQKFHNLLNDLISQ
jgi:hypothetical protein